MSQYGVCPACGQVPKMPAEFVTLRLAARPVTILNILFAANEQRVSILKIAELLSLTPQTLAVHISRIRRDLRFYKLQWKIVRVPPASYALIRAPYDKDSSAEREETPNT